MFDKHFKQNNDDDIELDPKRLKFGISPSDRRELERQEKAKRKPPKNWRPGGH